MQIQSFIACFWQSQDLNWPAALSPVALPTILASCPAGVFNNSKQVGIFPRIGLNYLLLSLLMNYKALQRATASKLVMCSLSHHEETTLFLISTFPAIAEPSAPPCLPAIPVALRATRAYKMCPPTDHELYSPSDNPQQACWSQALCSPSSAYGHGWPVHHTALLLFGELVWSGWRISLSSVILHIAASCALEISRVFDDCDHESSTRHSHLSNSRCSVERELWITGSKWYSKQPQPSDHYNWVKGSSWLCRTSFCFALGSSVPGVPLIPQKPWGDFWQAYHSGPTDVHRHSQFPLAIRWKLQPRLHHAIKSNSYSWGFVYKLDSSLAHWEGPE